MQSFTCSVNINIVLMAPSSLSQASATNMADVFTSQADGILMSDVALQSQICDFCQAVFPGDTSTRGDFLRHLYTHIT